MSLSNYLENAFLNHLRGTTYTAPAGMYVKLHISDPGEDAATGAAATTTRVAATFSESTTGSMALSAAIEWTNLGTAEIFSHFSVWDTVGPTGGNPLGYGPLNTPADMGVGDTFRLTAATWSLN